MFEWATSRKKHFYASFVDLAKVHDCIDLGILFEVLVIEVEVPPCLVEVLVLMYEKAP